MDWQALALESIKRWESCRLKCYPDPATGGDPWTIGWGTTGPTIKRGLTWTQTQADAALLEDVKELGRDVKACAKRELLAHERAALVSFAYNVGIGALRGSTLLRLLNAGNTAGAATQFLRWDKANGKQMRGLSRRREAERQLFLGEGSGD
jgi:lysozyme